MESEQGHHSDRIQATKIIQLKRNENTHKDIAKVEPKSCDVGAKRLRLEDRHDESAEGPRITTITQIPRR